MTTQNRDENTPTVLFYFFVGATWDNNVIHIISYLVPYEYILYTLLGIAVIPNTELPTTAVVHLFQHVLLPLELSYIHLTGKPIIS